MYQSKYFFPSFDVLEPMISTRTLYYQDRFYEKAIEQLNQIKKDERPLEEMVIHIDEYPLEDRGMLLYLAGRILNHELYFNSIGKNNHMPVGKLKEKIIETYGSYEQFIEEFKRKSFHLVGSGYTFLVMDREGNLKIVNLPNEETPYLYGMIPIMALDLWEHSYYLDSQDRMIEYIDAFFEVIDYEKINDRYEKNIL